MLATIEAYKLTLNSVIQGHPDKALALAQIDGLIAQLQVNEDGSVDLDRPMAELVTKIRDSLR